MIERDQRMNRLLELLSVEDYDRLRPHLTKGEWENKQPLYEAGRPIERVYFPIDGVASLVLTMKDGFGVEVGTIGSEGVVGLPVILGDTCAPSTVYVQVPGRAVKMDARVFRTELARKFHPESGGASLRSRLLQPSGSIGGLRASSQDRTTLLPLAADDPRSDAIR
jgi:CRP-like cAMP-binding protein